MRKSLYYVFSIMVLPLLLVSCDKADISQGEDGERTDTLKMSQLVIPLTFDKFLDKSDVVICDKDTSAILVRNAYLQKTNNNDIIDSLTFIAAWLAEKEHPFYRRILRTEIVDGGDLTKMYLGPADVSECLPAGTYDLSTELYYNKKERPRTNDGSFNELYYIDNETNVYHPISVWTRGGDGENAGDYLPCNYDSLGDYSLVEDMVADNFSFNPKLTTKLIRRKLYLNSDTTHQKIGFERIEVAIEAGLNFKLDIGTEHKQVKLFGIIPYYTMLEYPYMKEFESSLSVDLKTDFKAVLQMTFAKEKADDVHLGSLKAVDYIFMIGPVPVLISCNPEIVFGYNYRVGASAGLVATGKIDTGIKAGARYKGSWEPVWDSHFDKDLTFGFQLDGELYNLMGIFLKVPVYIDHLAGPYIKAGPCFETKINGQASIGDEEHNGITGSSDFLLRGEFGAEIKFLKWSLADWKTYFDFLKVNLVKYPSSK